VEDYADGEMLDNGTVRCDSFIPDTNPPYADTYASDDMYESLTEVSVPAGNGLAVPDSKNAADDTGDELENIWTYNATYPLPTTVDANDGWYTVERGRTLYFEGFDTSWTSGFVLEATIRGMYATGNEYDGTNWVQTRREGEAAWETLWSISNSDELMRRISTNLASSWQVWYGTNITLDDIANMDLRFINNAGAGDAAKRVLDWDFLWIEVKTRTNSIVDHIWTIDVTGGASALTFNVEAYHTASVDGDDFTFYYSTTGAGPIGGAGWTPFLTVTATSDPDTTMQASLPKALNGTTVYIGVVDTDRVAGNFSFDTLYIDWMFIEARTDNTSNIKLTWQPSTSLDLNHYVVYRSTTVDGFTYSEGEVIYNSSTNPGYELAPVCVDAGAGDGDPSDHFYVVRAVDTTYIQDDNTDKAGKSVNALGAGWNMISVPLVQVNTSISAVLTTIGGNYAVAEWYDASDDTWHDTNGDLMDVDRTMALWVYMNVADDMVTVGRVPTATSIQLNASGSGWNFVGYPSLADRGVANALSPIDGYWEAVQHYDASDPSDHWKHNNTAKPAYMNDLDTMTIGSGYWLRVNTDCTWTISGE